MTNLTLDAKPAHLMTDEDWLALQMHLLKMNRSAFFVSWQDFQRLAHANATRKGFWEIEDHPAIQALPNEVKAEIMAMRDAQHNMLVVTEISEAVEGARLGEGTPSDKLTGFTQEEEELADAVIRIMDRAERRGLRLPYAIAAKMEYNLHRPRKHGKRY